MDRLPVPITQLGWPTADHHLLVLIAHLLPVPMASTRQNNAQTFFETDVAGVPQASTLMLQTRYDLLLP